MSSEGDVPSTSNNENADRPKTSSDAHDRAERFLTDLLGAHRSYHHHKENMAYAGVVAYLLAFGAALTAKTWPPLSWLDDPFWQRWITIATSTIAWLVVLAYLRWQLGLRYWAAVHVAATQGLLAKWITKPPRDEDLVPWVPPSNHTKRNGAGCQCMKKLWSILRRGFQWVTSLIWPSNRLSVKPDVPHEVYPSAVVEAWQDQAERGSGAIYHSRLVLCTCWFIYVALLVRTLMWSP